MKRMLNPEERLERLRMLGERLELERLDVKTPAQLRRLADLERLLETGRPPAKGDGRGKTKVDPRAA